MNEIWSVPDANGIKTMTFDVGAKRTMRGKRRRRSILETPTSVVFLAEDQKGLIRNWVKGVSPRRKWSNLLTTSGFSNLLLSEELLKTLLEAGWIEVEEHRTSHGWETVWVEFLAYEELREHLGLSNRDKERVQADSLQADFSTDVLRIAAAQLDSLPVATKIKRYQLLCGLDSWSQEGLQGTRRDFSLFVRGRTKDITTTEWDWLESQVDLESLSIASHIPMIRLKIPGILKFTEGQIDFRLLPGAVALTMEQISGASSFEGEISCWKVIENLTSFERAISSSRKTEGVIWVPGFAPSWWVKSISHLLSLTKAPGMVACDPDPAGLLIASQVGGVWDSQAMKWEPWCMAPSDFEGKGRLIPMTEFDCRLLNTFNQRINNHRSLVILAKWLENTKMKLEQESFI